MKKLIILGATMISLSAFAASGDISIPGVGNIKGSTGSTVENSTISVTDNKSGKVYAIGGSVGGAGIEGKMSGSATVNSVHIKGSTVKGSTITVSGNSSDEVYAIGGTALVNSVQID